MAENKLKKERYKQEIDNFEPITIKDLVCKDCVYAYEDIQLVTKCFKYPVMKPGKVIYGKDCPKYKKDEFKNQ